MADEALTMTGFFPGSVKNCKEVSGTFFQCFNEKSTKSAPEDTAAGAYTDHPHSALRTAWPHLA